MKKPTAREVALKLLETWEEKETYSNLLIKEGLMNSSLSAVDQGLVTELVYGCIQRYHTLHTALDRYVKKGVRRLAPWVRLLLCTGIYQLWFLDRIPNHAVVHSTVQIAKQRGHQGIAGLVNGVLRSFLRNPISLPNLPKTQSEKAFVYSFPEWMIGRIENLYGEEEAAHLMRSTLHPPKTSLRLNRLRQDRNDFLSTWSNQVTPSEIIPEGMIYSASGNPAFHPEFQQGLYTLQDESSMLVGQLLPVQPGMRILDACAAPGGKTTHIAERMGDQGQIVACDIYQHKIRLIEKQAKRLGLSSIQTKPIDARELSIDKDGQFDAVLLDAPCSGFGVIRRKPDLKWRKKREDISSLVRLQAELLESVSQLVKPGGTLLYSTCTWEAAENQEQMESFLARQEAFEPDPSILQSIPNIVKRKARYGEYWLQILPHHFQSDGFFIARLQKKKT